MDEKRLRGLMGLSVRAGQAVFGEDGCLWLLRSDGCGVLLMDETISDTAKERYLGVCERAGVRAAVLSENLLFFATGRPGKAMAVCSGPLAEQIVACLGNETE